MIAVRTDCSASSGRTMMAGGGWRPIRCSAASTSAMVARRPSSERRRRRSLSSSGFSRDFGLGDAVLGVAQPAGAVDQGLVELAAILADGVDLVLELGLGLGGLLLLGADRLELLIALAQRVERGFGAGMERGGAVRAAARRPSAGGQRAKTNRGSVPKRSSMTG